MWLPVRCQPAQVSRSLVSLSPAGIGPQEVTYRQSYLAGEALTWGVRSGNTPQQAGVRQPRGASVQGGPSFCWGFWAAPRRSKHVFCLLFPL